MAEIKNENINFIYRISGKSIIEQDPNNRPALGLITYPRGMIETFYRNGYKPVADNLAALTIGLVDRKRLDEFNFSEFRNGWRVMGMQQVAATLSGIVAAYVIGNKGEDEAIFNDVGAYLGGGPMSPGMSLTFGVVDGGIDLIKAAFTEDMEDNAEKWKKVITKGAFMVTPLLPDLKTLSETMNNKQFSSNLEFIRSYTDPNGANWEYVEREGYMAFKHFAFGTVKEDVPDDKELLDLLREQNFLMRWYGSEDEWKPR